jgi:heterotetrameric sarcosine oxidase beta subunit
MKYSLLSLVRNALSGHQNWQPAWRSPDPKPHYDVIIIGGGGHGLATAYYLAKVHGITNVAVLEKGYLGSGNIGRNTTIIRSNYLLPGNNPFYEKSLQLWEGLEQDFNFNAMVSQRGVINLYHSDGQRDAYIRRGNAMRMHGVDAEILDQHTLREMLPFLNFDNGRFPIMGGLMQRRGGTVRHDAVAWGYARGADSRGVDIIQHCEVTGIRRDAKGLVTGVDTTKGFIGCNKLGLAAAGNSTTVAKMAGLQLPIDSHVLQAFVSEGLKPWIDNVVTFGVGHFLHFAIGQGRAGVRRRHRRLQLLCTARQPADGGTRHRVWPGDDPVAEPGAGAARVGRHHGHVDGRIADHRQDADRQSLPECGLVLWRLQGDAGLGLVLCPYHREGRTTRAEFANAA